MKKLSFFSLAALGLLSVGACKSSSGTAASNIENENVTLEGAYEQVGDTRTHIVFAKNGTFFTTYASTRVEGRYTATHTTAGLSITLSLKDEETIVADDPPVVDAGKDTGTSPVDAGKTDAGKVDAGGGVADAGKSDAGGTTKDAGVVTPDPGETNGDEVFGAIKLTKYEFLTTGKRGTLLLRNDSGSRQFKKLTSYCIEAADCSAQGLNTCATGFTCGSHVCACGSSKGSDAGTPKPDAGK